MAGLLLLLRVWCGVCGRARATHVANCARQKKRLHAEAHWEAHLSRCEDNGPAPASGLCAAHAHGRRSHTAGAAPTPAGAAQVGGPAAWHAQARAHRRTRCRSNARAAAACLRPPTPWRLIGALTAPPPCIPHTPSFRTSGAIFENQLSRAGLLKQLEDLAEFVFIDAPFTASGPIPRCVRTLRRHRTCA